MTLSGQFMLINLLIKDFLKDIRFLLEIIFLNLKFNLFIKESFLFFDVKKSVNFVLLFIFFKAHKDMPTRGTVQFTNVMDFSKSI